MKKWKCLVCGFVWESDEENPVCPVCGVDGDQIEEVKEGEDK